MNKKENATRKPYLKLQVDVIHVPEIVTESTNEFDPTTSDVYTLDSPFKGMQW